MREILVFSNSEFGNVRTMEIGGEPWLVEKDVADALGYKNGSRDICRHVDEDDRREIQIFDGVQNRNVIVINESGLYSLVFSSKLESAKRFKHWVTSEVLPSIRKNSGYIQNQENLSDSEILAKALVIADQILADRKKRPINTKEPIKRKCEKNTSGWKSVYVMFFNDQSVKIGISQNVRTRANALQGSSGKTVEDYLYSPMCSNAEEIERILHDSFRENRIRGEWFAIDFGEAKSRLMEVFGENALFEERDDSRADALIDFLKHDFIGYPRTV